MLLNRRHKPLTQRTFKTKNKAKVTMICSMSTLVFYRFYVQTWYTYNVQHKNRKVFPLQTDESDNVPDWPLYVRGTAPTWIQFSESHSRSPTLWTKENILSLAQSRNRFLGQARKVINRHAKKLNTPDNFQCQFPVP